MSIRAMAWAWEQELPATTKMVLLALADHHNDETGQCNPRVKRVAEKAGLGESTTAKHLTSLAKAGLVAIENNKREDGSLTSSTYSLMLPDTSQSPPGPPDRPGSPPDRPHRTGIEPEENSNTPEETNVSSAPKGAKKRVTEIDEQFRRRMREKYGDTLGEEVDFHIDQALNHTARKKAIDLGLYVQGWLNREAKNYQRGKPNAVNGQQRNIPANPGRNPEASRSERQRQHDDLEQRIAEHERAKGNNDAHPGGAGETGVSLGELPGR